MIYKLEKKGTSSSVNAEVTDDEPVFDKDITPQTIAIGRFDI
jgi:hypothetical protein